MAPLTVVLKAGGDLAANPAWLAAVASDVEALRARGIRVVLVHGGGPQLDARMEADGITVQRVAGRRPTTPETLALAIQEWRGTLSLAWVSALRVAGTPAVGLCGADGGTLIANVRAPTTIDGVLVDFGEVGDLQEVRGSLLAILLHTGFVPVVSPLATTESGRVLNINADTVAAAIAAALHADALIVLTRAPGILRDPDDPRSLVARGTLAELRELERQGAIRDGMRPKLAAMASALERGVQRALVVDGRRAGAAVEALDGITGTTVVA